MDRSRFLRITGVIVLILAIAVPILSFIRPQGTSVLLHIDNKVTRVDNSQSTTVISFEFDYNFQYNGPLKIGAKDCAGHFPASDMEVTLITNTSTYQEFNVHRAVVDCAPSFFPDILFKGDMYTGTLVMDLIGPNTGNFTISYGFDVPNSNRQEVTMIFLGSHLSPLITFANTTSA